jgi:hypothetical protein
VQKTELIHQLVDVHQEPTMMVNPKNVLNVLLNVLNVKDHLTTVPYVPQTESPHQIVFVKPDSMKLLDRQNVNHVIQNVLHVLITTHVPTVMS